LFFLLKKELYGLRLFTSVFDEMLTYMTVTLKKTRIDKRKEKKVAYY